jgi:diadenosine tetraphosphate (Ap4A) HIT family hydrolase
MSEFRIHPQLLADCHRLGRLPACHLLLHRNAHLPWLILVPEMPVLDLLDLPPAQREQVLAECAQVSAYIKGDLGLPKVNFAAIGNLVPQLHLHVVGRTPGDACWPAPVWGNLPPGPGYSQHRLREIVAGLSRRCILQTADPAGPSAAPSLGA